MGEGICSLWQGWDPHPTPFPLQNGYINFDKRRKVRRVLGHMPAICSPIPGKGEEGSRIRQKLFSGAQAQGSLVQPGRGL